MLSEPILPATRGTQNGGLQYQRGAKTQSRCLTPVREREGCFTAACTTATQRRSAGV